MERLENRAVNLSKHFELAVMDVEDIKISAKKASRRATKIDEFEFEEKNEQNIQFDKS